jgi:hypothetical protein
MPGDAAGFDRTAVRSGAPRAAQDAILGDMKSEKRFVKLRGMNGARTGR